MKPLKNKGVGQQWFLAAAADSSLLSDCVPECLTGGTASFGLGKRGEHGGCLSSWKCFLYADVFSVTLFCVMKIELNVTLLVLCKQCSPTMSHLCQVHTRTQRRATIRSSRVPVWWPRHLSNSPSPPWQKPEFLLPPVFCFFLHFSLPKTPFPFSHVLLLHPSCLRSQLCNYHRLACRLVTLD